MARTWDKYGANIRNSNMEAKLAELGIDATVKSLSQADKALLRTIILLDASKGAWSDLAHTINTPANQFRILANNIKILGQMIGQILLPVVAKVLPYINALVIALQRLFTWLAKILHIDLTKLDPNSDGKLTDNYGIGEFLDDAEDLGDALDKDTDSAKKFKKQLQGFDALNNLTSKEDSDKDKGLGSLASGLLNDAFMDAVDDYLKAWQKAFDSLEDNAKKIADKIERFFKNLIAPIRRAWEKMGDKVVASWKRAFSSLGKLLESLRISFWRVWGEQDTQRIFEHIFGIVANLGDIFANLQDRFIEAWDENLNGYHILKAIRDIALTIVEHFHEMSDSVVEWSENINFEPLLNKLGTFLESMNVVIGHLMDVMKDFLDTVLLPLAKWTIEEGLPKLLQVFIDLKDRVHWEELKQKLHELFEAFEPFAERVGEGIILFIEDVGEALVDFVNSDIFTAFLDALIKWMDNTSARDVADTLKAIAVSIIALKGALVAFKAVESVTKTLTTVQKFLELFGAGGALSSVAKNITATSKAIGGLSSAIFMLGYGGMIREGKMQMAFAEGGSDIAKYAMDVKKGTANADEFADALEDVSRKLGNADLDRYAHQLQDLFRDGQIDAEGYAKAMEKINEIARENVENAKWYEPKNKQLFDIGTIATEAEACFDYVGQQASGAFDNSFKENTTEYGEIVVDGIVAPIEKSSPLFQQTGEVAGSKLEDGFMKVQNTLLMASKKLGGDMSSYVTTPQNLQNAEGSGTNMGQSVLKGFVKSESPMLFKSASIGMNVVKKMNESTKSASAVGSNLISGVDSGMSKNAPRLFSKAISIASTVLNVFDKVWKIGSPSKVMDEKGVFFMQGFQNGIESMYSPIEKSIGEFGSEIAEAPDLESEFALNGSRATISATQTVNAENGETNALLRQQNSLLQAILEKDTGISAGEIFKSVQSSATSYYRMTGNRAFT